ncbi:carboxymuconolactone decarboxylase family protein [Rhodococcus sp. HNM0569]|uniref:carboxymuconolactone decarboxylase family protein n=1 Tax=Rhodococcus sp. HNM0569 TaxID=2716340 RepID=UPI00146A870A|nr:carboxymuconolactone decarboxylase family protein [Rhodococcus sp. HNM0569]NLU84526.1 4-carboxymuconolactone decarboxylase [Rhodococcus sp. HNM0569]
MSESSSNPRDDQFSDAVRAGLRVRREVMSDPFVDAALDRTAGTESQVMQEFVTEHVWDAVWNRPGLDRRSRSLVNLGMLIALRAHGELRGHVRGALRNGLTRDEIVEVVVQASAYCGAPAGLSAMAVVQEVFEANVAPE